MSTAILTIAGSDSSGGAGIQADLRTFAAHGCYGTSVITALTAQNTTGVQGVQGTPPEFVAQQLRSVLDDIDVRAIKTGMLLTAENISAVVSTLQDHFVRHGPIPFVCDPVCVSTSGHVLLEPDAVDTMIDALFPLAQVITPNQAEAELLLKTKHMPCAITSPSTMLEAAQKLLTLHPNLDAVLLKGGHVAVSKGDLLHLHVPDGVNVEVRHVFPLGLHTDILQRDGAADIVVDVLCQRGIKTITLYPRPRIRTKSTHGTGCTLSAALACALGNGIEIQTAIAQATTFTHLGIETAPPIGKGYGPLNHLHSVPQRIVPPRTPSNPFPLTNKFIQSTPTLWETCVAHKCIVSLDHGTLDVRLADLLKHYGTECKKLAASIPEFNRVARAVETIRDKSAVPPSETSGTAATNVYVDFLKDVGSRGDTTRHLIALVAYLAGCGQVGLNASKAASTWFLYAKDDFQNAVSNGLETMETHAEAYPPSLSQFQEWLVIWKRSILLQKDIWDEAISREDNVIAKA